MPNTPIREARQKPLLNVTIIQAVGPPSFMESKRLLCLFVKYRISAVIDGILKLGQEFVVFFFVKILWQFGLVIRHSSFDLARV